MKIDPATIALIRDRLSDLYAERFQQLIIFGSSVDEVAERSPTSDIASDIDCLVVIEGAIDDYGTEVGRILDVVYPIAVAIGRRVSCKPVTAAEFARQESPLHREILRTGRAA